MAAQNSLGQLVFYIAQKEHHHVILLVENFLGILLNFRYARRICFIIDFYMSLMKVSNKSLKIYFCF